MIDILKEIHEKLMNIEVCIEELKDKILENDDEMEQLKEQLDIRNNAEGQEESE